MLLKVSDNPYEIRERGLEEDREALLFTSTCYLYGASVDT